jgi:hypothetical protein
MTFDKSRHMIKIQGNRSYLPVAARLIWFRQEHADWGIQTEIVEINHEKQYAVFRASIIDDVGRVIATATKKEDVKGFGDFLEKSETGAVGRALAMCGYSTDADPDFDEGKNGDAAHIVDSPQDFGRNGAPQQQREQPQHSDRDPRNAPPPTEAQDGGEVKPCYKCGSPVRFGFDDNGKSDRFNADGKQHFRTCGRGGLTGFEEAAGGEEIDEFA